MSCVPVTPEMSHLLEACQSWPLTPEELQRLQATPEWDEARTWGWIMQTDASPEWEPDMLASCQGESSRPDSERSDAPTWPGVLARRV